MTSTLPTLVVTLAVIPLALYFGLRRRFVLAGICLVCFFALLRPGVVYGADLCQPTRYADGDTFTYLVNRQSVRVRVAGFDAPERGQPFGQAARAKLQALTSRGVQCDCYKSDRHGRSVCTVRTMAGQNVATLMLRAGMGCIDSRFEAEASAEDREAAREALRLAQAERLGMWSQRDPECAFDYRRRKNA